MAALIYIYYVFIYYVHYDSMLLTMVIIEVTPAAGLPSLPIGSCSGYCLRTASSVYLYLFPPIYWPWLSFEGASPGWQPTPFFIIMRAYTINY
jgi:hypothetical protein